jgi:hypothetical protein
MRFSRLSFRVTFILISASFLAVCASAQSKASLRGAVVVSEDLVSAVPLEVSAVKRQVTPIPTWTVLRRQDAGSAATITSKQFEP